MSAMRRILSPAAAPTDTIPRVDSLQANTMMFLPSSASSTSSSVASPPHWSQRRRRGSIAQAASQQVIPLAVSSPLSVRTLSASAPSTITYQSDMYDTQVDDSGDDFEDELDDEDASDDLAMWASDSGTERSMPIAIPNAENGCHSHTRYASSPELPDARSIVSSYLVRHAGGGGESASRRTNVSSIQRSPFAPAVPFGEVMPGKPEMGDSTSRRMAYFDEDALY